MQTGHVNKEFQGVAALDWKDGKPQSQIGISHSQGPTQDPAGDYSTIELERGPSDIKKKAALNLVLCETGARAAHSHPHRACMGEPR